MRYITHNEYLNIDGVIFRVNSRKSGINPRQLKMSLRQINNLLTYHNKICLIRFDLHQPHHTQDNQQITALFRQLGRQLSSLRDCKRIIYGWTREQEKAKQQHYHCWLALDGNKIKSAFGILGMVEDLWHEIIGSHHWEPENATYMIKRGDHQSLATAVYRISYLAKGRGKGYRPQQTKDYGQSRLQPKQQPDCIAWLNVPQF